jgi:hypothetical protein
MFEHLDDPHTEDSGGRYSAVVAAGRRRLRLRRMAWSGTLLTVTGLVVAALLVLPGHKDQSSRLVTEPSPTPTATPAVTVRAVPGPTPRKSVVPHALHSTHRTHSPTPKQSIVSHAEGTPTPTGHPSCTRTDDTADGPAPTQAAFDARVAHAWSLCADPSVFGTHEDGLEIRNDGRWSKLQRMPDGSYTRLKGRGNEGTWESLDTADMNGTDSPARWQLNLNIDGSGTVITLPRFVDDGRRVHLDNNGVFAADYLQLPKGAIVG